MPCLTHKGIIGKRAKRARHYSVERSETPPPNHLGLDFHVYITYVCTFLICVRVLVICDRNSIARKREEFPAQVAEVASSRLHFA